MATKNSQTANINTRNYSTPVPKLINHLLVTTLGFTLSIVASAQSTSALSTDDLQAFCTDKPIWAAFAIEPETCLAAATDCAQKPEFGDINPDVLSEAFYHCVFTQLEIDVE